MNTKVAVTSVLFAVSLSSQAAFCSQDANSADAVQSSGQPQLVTQAEAPIAHLQIRLDQDVRAETLDRIKSESRNDLGRQVQEMNLFINDVPAIPNDLQITIKNPDRKIRLTSR